MIIIKRWTNATDLWLHGYWTWDWADNYVHVTNIDTSSSLFLLDPSTPPVYGLTENRRYYALNLLVVLLIINNNNYLLFLIIINYL